MAQQNSTLTTALTSPGADNGAASNTTQRRALFLKLFSGEMFKGFQRNTIARDLVMKRTLTNGKSLQFIYTGRTTAEYHTPGNSILGNSDGAPPVAEKTITCDDLLISSAFVYELDETLSHYDLRGEISRKIGYALLLRSMTDLSSVQSQREHVLLHQSLNQATLSPVEHRSD